MIVDISDCAEILKERHYLGPSNNALFGWRDDFGVMVFAKPRSRRLPSDWYELVRWCLYGEPNAGSQQWRAFSSWARYAQAVTTVVSYSDPSAGHTGALYRACNWWWAPTWHRLRPPPSGNGSWSNNKVESVKDRWVFALSRDDRRIEVLTIKDDAILRKMPWALYTEPGGANYKRFAA